MTRPLAGRAALPASWILAAALGAPGIGAQEASPTPEDPWRRVPVTLSAHGLPGLVNVPVAASLPTGSVDLSFNTVPDFDLWQGRADEQQNFHLAFSLFDRVVIGVRGSEVRASEPQDPLEVQVGPFRLLVPTTALERDLSAGAHAVLVKEKGSRPSLAVGATDVGGNALFEARYGVLSRTLPGGFRATAGFGLGSELLDGPFGGLEWSPSHHLTLVGEYDAHQLNGAIRIQPLRETLLARGVPRPTLDVVWSQGEGVYWGITVRSVMDGDLARRVREPDTVRPPGALLAGSDGPEGVEALRARLVELGLENLRVSVMGAATLLVEYENRTYNQNQLDALARALAAAGRHRPSGTEEVRIVVRRVDRPVLQVDVAVADLTAFLRGDMPREAFEERISVGYPRSRDRAEGPAPPAVNRSRLRLDLVPRFQIRTFLFTEIGVWNARFDFLPHGLIQLLPGTMVEGRYRLPADQTSDYFLLEGQLPDPELDRALIHHARRLSSAEARTRFWAQWSAGRFDLDHVGFRQETAALLRGGSVLLGTDVAYVGSDFEDLDQAVVLGRVRYLHSPVDARVTVTAGRFLDEDWGVAGEVSRFFGDTELGIFLRHSERGSLAGLRASVPLTVSRDLDPSRVRLRLPEEWSHAQTTTVFEDRNLARSDIARSLPTDRRLDQVYWDRDRLHPDLIRTRLADPRFWRR